MNGKYVFCSCLVWLVTISAFPRVQAQKFVPYESYNEKFVVENIAKIILISHRNPEPKIENLTYVNVESTSYKGFFLVREKSRGKDLLEELSTVVISRKTHFVFTVISTDDVKSVRAWCDRNQIQANNAEKAWLAKTKK